MNILALRKLTIEHLRGSVVPFSVLFEKNKKLTVVYGENGTGKSTICDAFEFLGKGRVGSIENRGLGIPKKYWPSLGKKPVDVSVTLEYHDNSRCRASIVKNDVIVDQPASRPQIEVLRRSQILSLIEAKPAERYAAIKRFIDVTGIEMSEASLDQSIRGITASRDTAIARIQENQEMLQRFWDSAGRPSGNYIDWAKDESARDPNMSDTEIVALAGLQAAFARLDDYPSSFKVAVQTVEDAKAALLNAQKKAEACVQTMAADAGEVMSILESARTYLHKHPKPAACPLCESAEKIESLEFCISQRLAAFSSLQSAQSSVKAATAGCKRAEQQLELLKSNAKNHAEEFEKMRASFSWSSDIPLPASPCPDDIAQIETWLTTGAQLRGAWEKAKSARQEKKQFVSALKGALKAYNDNVSTQKEIDVLLPKLKRALEIVREERRQFTDDILSKIASEVGRIYEMVHPGEGLNKISLELDPAKRASLEIGASFCGSTGTPPQAYFSESHLDTLGLCVFLALASLEYPSNTILVLDDILASVDEPHVERLIEMLYAETAKFRHCIITTHYRPWKERLRWGWLKTGECHFIELSKWTTQNGLSLAKTLPEIDRLKRLLDDESPDVQAICSKAGIILEAALNFLSELYECAVPRKSEDRYTIGDLLPSINGKLRKSLRVEVQTGTDETGNPIYKTEILTPVFDELSRIAEVRNVFGCHFKAVSFELLDSDAMNFGRQVYKLMELLIDQEAGWPKKSNSGEYWTNSTKSRRLYPLRKPS